MAIFKRGSIYWFEFVFNGRRIQRSTKQANRKAAIDIESAYRTTLAKGEVGIEEAKQVVPISQLVDAVEEDYRVNGNLSEQNRSNVKRVRADFGAMKSDSVTAESINRYISKRLASGDRPATVNRTMELLRRAYRLAKLRPPEIRHLSETDNVRRGFFTPAEFALVEKHLPDDLKDFCRFGFLTGWRKSEIASLTWADIQDGTIYLRAEKSKNRESRSIPISGALKPLIERSRQARKVETQHSSVLAANLFHRGGQPIGEFRKSWASACVAGGLGAMICPGCQATLKVKRCPQCKKRLKYTGRIFHDLRRSAVKNLIDSGVNQKTAMEISGHKTDAMFRRYHIVSQKDKATALEQVQEHNKRLDNVVSM